MRITNAKQLKMGDRVTVWQGKDATKTPRQYDVVRVFVDPDTDETMIELLSTVVEGFSTTVMAIDYGIDPKFPTPWDNHNYFTKD